ncbi:MAG: hypothetical protein M4D80_00990 [Myxococcota bacterium]|nr:hypothetical protein [Myxococcota bacterium]
MIRCMGCDVYASDAVIITLGLSVLALFVASCVWGAVRVEPRRGRAAFMTICCFVIVFGVFLQGGYTEAGWRVIADAAVLLNIFMYVEIAHAIRSRRSTIPLAIAQPMCCRVARDGPDKPHHPALRAGRGGRVSEEV